MSIYFPLGGSNVGIGTLSGVGTERLVIGGNIAVNGPDLYVGATTQNARYASYGSNVVTPSADGRINGVSITALNKRTRTSGASAVECVRTWVTRASAADNNWISVCWAPELSLFVAVAPFGDTGNRVMTSSDGVTWRTRASNNNSWWSVCWAPDLSLFVAVAASGTGDRVMTSPDGIIWTTRVSAADNGWRSVCWAPELSLFVSVADTGTGDHVMTSPDGVIWTTRASTANNRWFSVCWAPEMSLFVAVAITGTGNRVMTSPDGVTWTTRASAAENAWISVCWAPELSLFVAVAESGTGNRVMTSLDGMTWTTRASNDNEWRSVCWAPELSLFVAVAETGTGNRVMTSHDGITWTTRASTDNRWHLVCWAPELSLFAAVAYSGTGDRVMTSAIGMPNAKSVVKALPSQMMVSANGNVGIGITNPIGKLNISGGTINIYDTTGNISIAPEYNIFGGLRIQSSKSGSTPYSTVMGIDTSTGVTFINSAGNSIYQPILLNARGGSVGIGTTYPDTTLEVAGTGGATFGIKRNIYNDYLVKIKLGTGNFTSADDTKDSTIVVGAGSTTNRSISCRGTVNGSGTDYAEYMYKDSEFTIAPGDIIGINKNGRLVNLYKEAITFCVKSTRPCIVGGDELLAKENIGVEKPDETNYKNKEEYQTDLENYNKLYEELRNKVDRVAFCGQVPINLYNGIPGNYVIPVPNEDGSIGIIHKSINELTLTEYTNSVGKIIAVASDGRAIIIIKIS